MRSVCPGRTVAPPCRKKKAPPSGGISVAGREGFCTGEGKKASSRYANGRRI
jgi:hypothetical protein